MNYLFYVVLAFYAVFVLVVGWSACRTTNFGCALGLLLTVMMGSMPVWVIVMILIFCVLTGQNSGLGTVK